MTDEQFQKLLLELERKKKPDVSWVRYVGPVATICGIVGAILVSYVFVTKSEAAEKHSEIVALSAITYERRNHAEEVHTRQEKDTDGQKAKLDMIITNQHKLDMILQNSYEAARASGVSRTRLRRVEED